MKRDNRSFDLARLEGLGEVQTVSGKLPGLRRRLEKPEKALAETAEQEKLANCICKILGKSRPTFARSDQPEAFEAEMSQTCLVHGFRDLGQILVMRITDDQNERFKLDDLLDEYRARKSEYERAEKEHETQKA